MEGGDSDRKGLTRIERAGLGCELELNKPQPQHRGGAGMGGGGGWTGEEDGVVGVFRRRRRRRRLGRSFVPASPCFCCRLPRRLRFAAVLGEFR